MSIKLYPIFGLFLSILLFSTLSAQEIPGVLIEDKTVEAGDIVEFDVLVTNFNQIVGSTFSVEWDSMQLRYVGINNIALGLTTDDSFGLTGASGGRVNYLYFDNSLMGNSIDDNTILFSLVLEVIAPESIITDITFGGALEVVGTATVDLNATFQGAEVDITVMVDANEAFSTERFTATVSPNPFNKDAQIQLEVPISGEVSWILSGMNGQKIAEGVEQLASGKQLLILPNTLFRHAGSYILKLEMEGISLSEKLIYVNL